jgi:hypothetical protein
VLVGRCEAADGEGLTRLKAALDAELLACGLQPPNYGGGH